MPFGRSFPEADIQRQTGSPITLTCSMRTFSVDEAVRSVGQSYSSRLYRLRHPDGSRTRFSISNASSALFAAQVHIHTHIYIHENVCNSCVYVSSLSSLSWHKTITAHSAIHGNPEFGCTLGGAPKAVGIGPLLPRNT